MRAYAGNPVSFPATVGVLEDTDAPNASNFDVAPQGNADRTAYLRAIGGVAAGQNWNAWNGNPGGVASGNTWWLSCACWDSYYGLWLVAGAVTAGGGLMKLLGSSDGGKTWVAPPSQYRSLPASGGSPFAIAVSPSTGTVCTWIESGGSYYVPRQGAGQPVPGLNVQTDSSSYSMGVLLNLGDVNSTFHFIGLVQTGGSYACYWKNGGVDGQGGGGGVWAPGGTLPSGWASGTSNVLCLLAATDAQPATSSTPAVAASNWIVALCGIGGDTDASRLLLNGTTDITPTFAATQVIRGLAYSPATLLWGVLASDAVLGGSSYLYTTLTPSDPTSWTLAHTFLNLYCSGLAVVGNVWATTFNRINSPAEPYNGVAYSLNVAPGSTTSTWCAGDYEDLVPMAPPTTTFHETRMLSSGGQFMRLAVGGSGPVATPGIYGGAVAISHQTALQQTAVGL